MRKEVVKLFIYSSFLAFAVIFFVSPDSYTHHLNGHGDSAWFFLCGKAWMNGLTPYVDFSDSKGPLLWLIYGIGYLLNRTSYIGVFWLSCIAYAITFFYTFKTARIWLSERSSFLATVLMSLAYLNPLLHYETRCEDFCLPFIVLSLYLTCRALYLPENRRSLSCTSFVLGLSFGSLMMLKYNIAAMQSIFPMAILLWAAKEKCHPWRCFGLMTIGFLSVTLPFVIWFATHGYLGAFIHEYFVLTFASTAHHSSSTSFFLGFLSPLTWPIAAVLLALVITGALLLSRQLSHWRWFPLIAFLFFLLIIVQNATCNYYYAIGTPFLLFLAVGLLLNIPISWRGALERGLPWLSMLTVLLCIYTNIEMKDKIGNLFFQDSIQHRAYSEISSAMISDDHPTIVYLGYMNGYGVPSEALPGCKYFARQDGELPFMLQDALDACSKTRTDYVVVDMDSTAYCRHVESAGYHKLVVDSTATRQVLYGKEKGKVNNSTTRARNRDV